MPLVTPHPIKAEVVVFSCVSVAKDPQIPEKPFAEAFSGSPTHLMSISVSNSPGTTCSGRPDNFTLC